MYPSTSEPKPNECTAATSGVNRSPSQTDAAIITYPIGRPWGTVNTRADAARLSVAAVTSSSAAPRLGSAVSTLTPRSRSQLRRAATQVRATAVTTRMPQASRTTQPSGVSQLQLPVAAQLAAVPIVAPTTGASTEAAISTTSWAEVDIPRLSLPTKRRFSRNAVTARTASPWARLAAPKRREATRPIPLIAKNPMVTANRSAPSTATWRPKEPRSIHSAPMPAAGQYSASAVLSRTTS